MARCLRGPRVDDPYGHSLRDIVKRHSQHHHGRLFELIFRPLCLVAFSMEVGNQVIQSQQEQNADQKSDKRRNKRQLSHPCRLFHRRNQQTPHRGCHHYAGGKTGQNALQDVAELSAHKEYAGRAQRCTEKGDQDAVNGLAHEVGRLSHIRFFLYPQSQ